MIDPHGLAAWYDEFNPFDPNSTMSRQALSIGKGMGGLLAFMMLDTTTAKLAFKEAASDCGDALLREANASPMAFKAYYGALALATAADLAAGALITAHLAGVSHVGYYSMHAIRQSIVRGITPGKVTRALNQGARFYDPVHGSTVWFFEKTAVARIGKVITTVMRSRAPLMRWIPF